MEAIADDVSGATTATVERVLDEYGDPVAGDSEDERLSAGDDSDDRETATAESREAEPCAATDGGASEPLKSSVHGGTTLGTSPRNGKQRGDAQERDPQPETSRSQRADENRDADETTDSLPSRSSLTEKQYETLRAIYENPDATQADLADYFDVSSPTISQRVNGIEGFDWSNRYALVAPLFESDAESEEAADDTGDEGSSTERASDRNADERDADRSDDRRSGTDDRQVEPSVDRDESTVQQTGASSAERTEYAVSGEDGGSVESSANGEDGESDGNVGSVDNTDARRVELLEQLEELTQRLATVERELSDRRSEDAAQTAGSSVLDDPELAHKIVHACMRADHISEDEELQLLRDVAAPGTGDRDDSA